jgi:hypothetical protein
MEVIDARWSAVVNLGNKCSGVLIKPDLLIYTAHCGSGFRTAFVPSSVGSTALPLSSCEVHPDGGAGNGFDIGFCLLRTPDRSVTPIPVASVAEAADALRPGDFVQIVGFGQAGDGLAPGTQRELRARIDEVDDKAIRASPEVGAGICGGDSGGPALIQAEDGTWRVGALASFTYEESCKPDQDLYLQKLADVVPWLEQASHQRIESSDKDDSDIGLHDSTTDPSVQRSGCCVTQIGSPVKSSDSQVRLFLCCSLIGMCFRRRAVRWKVGLGRSSSPEPTGTVGEVMHRGGKSWEILRSIRARRAQVDSV